MSFPFKDELFRAQWLRTAGHAHAGGADLGECLAAADVIHEPSVESWRDAWMAMADRVMRAAQASLAGGHPESARSGFLRASNYYRNAYVFLMEPNPGPRLLDAYRRQRDAFGQALAPRPDWGEKIAIPFEGETLHGYFFAAPGAAPRRARP